MIIPFGLPPERFLLSVFFFVIRVEILLTDPQEPIVEIKDNLGVFFKHMGTAFYNIVDENLTVFIDTQPIGKSIERLEVLNKRIAQLVSNSSIVVPQFEENIRRIKSNFEMVHLLVDRKRFRRDSTVQDALGDLIENRHLLENGTATALKIILLKLDLNFKRLEEALRKFDDFDHQTQILSISNQFLQIQQQIELQITELQNAVLFAKRNVIHPSVLSPPRLSNIIRSRSWPSSKGIRFPLDDTIESMAHYLDICTVSTRFEGQHLVFAISMPLVIGSGYDVYALLEFPKMDVNCSEDCNVGQDASPDCEPDCDYAFIFIKPTDNFLLVNVTVSKYSYLHSLDSCTAVDDTFWLCRSLAIHRRLDYSCETSILAQLQPNCTFHEYKEVPDIWYPVGDNQWAFAQNVDWQINITFRNGTTSTFELPINGILTVDGLADTSHRQFLHQTVINHRITQTISTFQLMSNATFSNLPHNFSSTTFEEFDFSLFEAAVNQSERQLETLRQLSEAIAKDKVTDSAQLQATLDQLQQLRTRQHNQLQQLNILQHQIEAVLNHQTTENAFQTSVNWILTTVIFLLVSFGCVFGYLMHRRIRKIPSYKAVPLELDIRNVDTCRTQ